MNTGEEENEIDKEKKSRTWRKKKREKPNTVVKQASKIIHLILFSATLLRYSL